MLPRLGLLRGFGPLRLSNQFTLAHFQRTTNSSDMAIRNKTKTQIETKTQTRTETETEPEMETEI